jgi:FixJ family two-component response regulator/signal transduction histidine kinase
MRNRTGTDRAAEERSSRRDGISPFERLLAELSARFIGLPPAEIVGAIDDALRRIATLIGADRGQLVHFPEASDATTITHSGALDDVPRVRPGAVTAFYPWIAQRIRSGAAVVVPDVAAMPEAAAVDRARFQTIGVRSNITVPLRIAGRIDGALAFGALRHTRRWEPEIVERLAMVADVFANALGHKRAREALDAALRFESAMSRALLALLTSDRSDRGRAIESGLADVARTFGAERATLWQREADGEAFVKTHRWLAPGVPEPAGIARDDHLPFVHAALAAGQVVRFARLADLPAEAAIDAATFAELGIRSAVIVPVTLGERVAGALSFASASGDREWPDALVPRVTLLGDVFATVFARDSAEQRERDAQAQAAHATRVGTLGMLAASLVHELTQPLAASLANAQTAAELLASPTPDLDELRAAVGDIVSDDRRVGEMIQQLRRFLRRGETERAEVDLRDPIGDALHLVAHDAAERRIAIDVVVEPGLPPVAADRVQIQQVLLNLLSNACDAVATAQAASRHVSLTASRTDSGVAIEVADHGPGLDEATLARIFQPFFTTKPKGMGLGLSISRSIVAAHGGKLTARSSVGQGTTLRLELPSQAPAAQAPRERAPAGPVSGGSVYVIDDDPSIRRALERQLGRAGYRVVVFDSAQAFLDHRREPGVGCIVSDLRMPGLSGLDLQASLAEARCDLPMIFVSGHGDISTAASALRAGAVNFLQKPFTREALLAAVVEAMACSRDEAERGARQDEVRRRYGALTAREREVFALVAAGLLNKLIADRLGAAEATIKIHRGRVMEKMEASSVADLVRMAETLGVATKEPPARRSERGIRRRAGV